MPHLKFIENAPVVETYLARLDRELKPLPPHERDAARRELRQHVDALVAAHEELGLSHADATKAALAHFGDARKIGGKLRREWRLSNRKPLDPMMAALFWALIAFLWTFPPVYITLLWLLLEWEPSGSTLFVLRPLVLCGLCPLVSGVVAENRKPGYGIAGVVYGAGAAAFLMGVADVLVGDTSSPYGGLNLAVTVFPAWILLGSASAYLTASRRKRRLVHRYSLTNLKLKAL